MSSFLYSPTKDHPFYQARFQMHQDSKTLLNCPFFKRGHPPYKATFFMAEGGSLCNRWTTVPRIENKLTCYFQEQWQKNAIYSFTKEFIPFRNQVVWKWWLTRFYVCLYTICYTGQQTTDITCKYLYFCRVF
jgi:hypothetical protein